MLASGEGTLLQALLEAASADPTFPQVVAVGSDRPDIEALRRAERAGVATFTLAVRDVPSRAVWDEQFTRLTAEHEPDLVVSAGFMKLAGPAFLDRFGGRYVNTHPALLPAFPGMHGARDALAYGVKVTGCTVFLVDAGVDTGPVIAQAAVPVLEGDDEATLHERIKMAERQLLVDAVGRLARQGWKLEGRTVVFL